MANVGAHIEEPSLHDKTKGRRMHNARGDCTSKSVAHRGGKRWLENTVSVIILTLDMQRLKMIRESSSN